MRHLVTFLLLFAGPLLAEKPAPPKPCPSCDKGVSRLAALTGAAAQEGAELGANARQATFVVTGMENDGLSAKVQESLAKTDGVHVEKVCHNSAVAVVKYDPAKTNPAALAKTIAASGATVTGQEVSFKVAGMTCTGCSSKLDKVLAKTEGVSGVKSVSHETGKATVLIDPTKTDEAKVAAVINKSGYKVQEG